MHLEVTREAAEIERRVRRAMHRIDEISWLRHFVFSELAERGRQLWNHLDHRLERCRKVTSVVEGSHWHVSLSCRGIRAACATLVIKCVEVWQYGRHVEEVGERDAIEQPKVRRAKATIELEDEISRTLLTRWVRRWHRLR